MREKIRYERLAVDNFSLVVLRVFFYIVPVVRYFFVINSSWS